MSDVLTPPVAEASAAQLLDVRAVAKLLGCSPRHVYRMTDAGKIVPPVRIGALVRWKANGPGSIQEWLDAGCPPLRKGHRNDRPNGAFAWTRRRPDWRCALNLHFLSLGCVCVTLALEIKRAGKRSD